MKYYQFNEQFVTKTQIPFVQQLLDCKNFSKSDRLLGTSIGRGITWFLETKEELGVNSVLRHYYRGGLLGKFIKDHYFFTKPRNTRAAKEFALLQQLKDWQLPVPHPLAFKITRAFGFYQADILLEKIDDADDLSYVLQLKALTTAHYQQIGQLIRQLHDRQVHHSDLNIHNIMIDSHDKFWLIDFDKCQVQQGETWKMDNLARLRRSFDKEQKRLGILFSETDWQALIAGYKTT